MELNGALSNPFVTNNPLLIALNERQTKLLGKASRHPRKVREAPTRRPPVLELVTRVLEEADRPMRAREVHAAAAELYGGPLRWHSVTQALSAYTNRRDRRFRRVSHGTYELTR